MDGADGIGQPLHPPLLAGDGEQVGQKGQLHAHRGGADGLTPLIPVGGHIRAPDRGQRTPDQRVFFPDADPLLLPCIAFLSGGDLPLVPVKGFGESRRFGLLTGNEDIPSHFGLDRRRPRLGLRPGIESLSLDRVPFFPDLNTLLQIAPFVEGRHHRLLFRQGLFVLSAQCSKKS